MAEKLPNPLCVSAHADISPEVKIRVMRYSSFDVARLLFIGEDNDLAIDIGLKGVDQILDDLSRVRDEIVAKPQTEADSERFFS